MIEDYILRLEEAGRGERGKIIDEMAEILGWSNDKVYRELKKKGWESGRKKRCDSGTTVVDDETLTTIAGMLKVGVRKNGKITAEVPTVRSVLADNGVTINVSNNRLTELLRDKGLDIKTQKKPTTFVRMRSLYPNHVHQCDPSVCLMYYLPNGGQKIIRDDEAYKNKPFLKDKEHLKLWRYVLTDHYSSSICVKYYQTAGESKEVVWDFLLYCWSKKNDPHYQFHGVPELLVWDKGSANTAKAVAYALKGLRVEHYAHKAGNPRAKGQVERSNDLVEKAFESRLKYEPVKNVEELNAFAEKWCAAYNAGLLKEYNSNLGRAKKTRLELWNGIPFDKLRELPECSRELLTEEPVLRRVGGDLKITFVHPRLKESRPYFVGGLPGVRPGIDVEVQPMIMDETGVVRVSYKYQDEEFSDEVEPIEIDEAGFHMDSAVWGEGFKTNKETNVEKAGKILDEAIGEEKIPFANFNDGQGIKSLSNMSKGLTNNFPIPRTGQVINVNEVPELTMSVIEASQRLKARMGFWEKRFLTLLKENFPNGVRESELDRLEDVLTTGGDINEIKECVS